MPTPNDGEAVWPKVIEAAARLRDSATLDGNAEAAARFASIIADMEARDRIGRERYGTPLQPFNGRDARRDMYEGLLDASAYAMQDLMESASGATWDGHYDLMLTLVMVSAAVRRGLDEREAGNG